MLLIVFILFISISSSSETNDDCPTSSNVIKIQDIQDAAHASKQIYDDELLEGNTIPGTKFKVTKRFHYQLHEDGEGIRVIVADSGNTRIIVYRGTDGSEQLLQQGGSLFKSSQEWTVDGVKTEVLKFFYQAYKLTSFQIRPYIADSSKKYILTGHSLGGALASILALDATQISGGSVWKNSKSCLITFGQPRVGGDKYVMVHDRLISTFRKLRFVYLSDIVTGIPPTMFGWKHHSRAVYIGSSIWESCSKRKRITKSSVNTTSTDIAEDPTPNIQNDSENLSENVTTLYDNGNQTKNSKRFIYTYWQICGLGEDNSCVDHAHNSVSFPSHHKISTYVKAVSNPPSCFLTRKGSKKRFFHGALIGTCRHNR